MNTDRTNSRTIPVLYLEKMLLGELDEATTQRLEQEFGKETLQLEVDKLRQSSEGLGDSLRQEFQKSPLQDFKTRSSHRSSVMAWALSAAAIVFIIFSLPLPHHDDSILMKGQSSSLLIYKKNVNQAVETLENGAELKAGDQIQIAYRENDYPFGAIFSIDGLGHVTEHFPLGSSGALRLHQTTVLDKSFQLDDAPNFEVFYFVRSRKAIQFSELMPRIQALLIKGQSQETIALGQDLPVLSFVIHKKEL